MKRLSPSVYSRLASGEFSDALDLMGGYAAPDVDNHPLYLVKALASVFGNRAPAGEMATVVNAALRSIGVRNE